MTTPLLKPGSARPSQAVCPIIRGDFWDPSPDFTSQRNSLIEKIRSSGVELPDGFLTVLRYKTRQSGASTGRKDWYYEGPYGKWDSVNKLIDSIKVHLGVADPVEEEGGEGAEGGSHSGPESDASDQDMLDASEVATTLSRFQHEAALLGCWVDCSNLLSKCTDDWRQWGRVMLIMQELQCANADMLRDMLKLVASLPDDQLPQALRSAQQGSKGSLVKSRVLLQKLVKAAANGTAVPGKSSPADGGKGGKSKGSSKEGSKDGKAGSKGQSKAGGSSEKQKTLRPDGAADEQQPQAKRRKSEAKKKVSAAGEGKVKEEDEAAGQQQQQEAEPVSDKKKRKRKPKPAATPDSKAEAGAATAADAVTAADADDEAGSDDDDAVRSSPKPSPSRKQQAKEASQQPEAAAEDAAEDVAEGADDVDDAAEQQEEQQGAAEEAEAEADDAPGAADDAQQQDEQQEQAEEGEEEEDAAGADEPEQAQAAAEEGADEAAAAAVDDAGKDAAEAADPMEQ